MITNYLIPKTNNIILKRQNELAASLNAKLLRVGSFIHPQNGITFYIGGISNSGIIEDVFVLDERNKNQEIIDGLGDSFVTLIILCYQLELEPKECLQVAWDEIKDRKGKTVDGTFIRE